MAIIIPAEIVRKYCIDTSTLFVIRTKANEKKVILRMISGLEDSDQSYTNTPVIDNDRVNSEATGAEI